jgi:hypothetical protein
LFTCFFVDLDFVCLFLCCLCFMGFVWFILFSLFYVSMPSQAVSLFLISLFMCLVFSQFLVGSSPRVPFVLFLISKLLSLLSSLFVVVRFPFV